MVSNISYSCIGTSCSLSGLQELACCIQGVDETCSHLPRPTANPLETGDSSVHGGNVQSQAGVLYAHIAQQQQLHSAGLQHEHGGAVRGANAAATALQLAQVSENDVDCQSVRELVLCCLLLLH